MMGEERKTRGSDITYFDVIRLLFHFHPHYHHVIYTKKRKKEEMSKVLSTLLVNF